MVEFSLVFLLFLAVFIGMVEFSRAVWTYTTVAHSARQAARFAMVRGTVNAATDDQIREVIERNAVGLTASDLSVDTDWLPDRQRGSIVRVRVEYPFRSFVGTWMLPSSEVELASSARAVIAQ
jgi:hypothetical protein